MATGLKKRKKSMDDNLLDIDELLSDDGFDTYLGPAPRCEWCGRFCRDWVHVQPPTDQWKLEPEDVVLVCSRGIGKT